MEQGVTERKVILSAWGTTGKKKGNCGGYLAIFRLQYIILLCISNRKLGQTNNCFWLGMETVAVEKTVVKVFSNKLCILLYILLGL